MASEINNALRNLRFELKTSKGKTDLEIEGKTKKEIERGLRMLHINRFGLG